MSETHSGPPAYSTKKKPIAVHIADEIYSSWVSVDGNGITASKIEIVAGGEGKDHWSKLILEIPMLAVEVVP